MYVWAPTLRIVTEVVVTRLEGQLKTTSYSHVELDAMNEDRERDARQPTRAAYQSGERQNDSAESCRTASPRKRRGQRTPFSGKGDRSLSWNTRASQTVREKIILTAKLWIATVCGSYPRNWRSC